MLTSRQASALCALALQNSFQNLIVRYSRVGGASGGEQPLGDGFDVESWSGCEVRAARAGTTQRA